MLETMDQTSSAPKQAGMGPLCALVDGSPYVIGGFLNGEESVAVECLDLTRLLGAFFQDGDG